MVTAASSNVPSFPNNTGLPSGPSGAGNGHDDIDGMPDLVTNVVEGAHQTIDRLADQAMPHVQRLKENVASATEMLDERADQIREMTDEWMETLRCTVREHPLAALGAALALGLVVARLSR